MPRDGTVAALATGRHLSLGDVNHLAPADLLSESVTQFATGSDPAALGLVAGMVMDGWQRTCGCGGKGEGAKYLILGPGHEEMLLAESADTFGV